VPAGVLTGRSPGPVKRTARVPGTRRGTVPTIPWTPPDSVEKEVIERLPAGPRGRGFDVLKLASPSFGTPSEKTTDPGVKIPFVAQAADPAKTSIIAITHTKTLRFMGTLLS